jgi:SAM-dependent methyltransferase
LLQAPGRFAKYVSHFSTFRRLRAADPDRFSRIELHACVWDEHTSGTFDRHYVNHCAWAARVLASIAPRAHVDISSTAYFAAIVSAFIPVSYYEYRRPELEFSNLESGCADLLRLPFADGSISSISCMHVVEHVGLGRYGDPLDPCGDLRAVSELIRVTAPGGHVLFVVPVGRPRIMFNAHRIYSFEMIKEAFSGMDLAGAGLVPDQGPFVDDPAPALMNACSYGCGCFHFVKA